VSRRDQTRVAKKICESKSDERRKMGILIMRWLEDIENDLGQLNVKRWRQKGIRGKNGQPNNKHKFSPAFSLTAASPQCTSPCSHQ
jgi:hypothetical protein